MHRSHGLQGSLKRRYKHPSPTSINGYHTAKKLLSQSPAKRPTFAFTSESGYTLGFRRRIAHKGSHAETGAVSDGGGITTLGAFRTFTNIHGPGVRTANFAAFGSWLRVLPKNAESLRNSDALMRVAVPKASRPRWAALLCLQFGDVAVFSLCAQYFLNVRDTGGITTLGVLCMLPKCRTAACQSGLFVVFLRPLFTFAKAPAGHCQYPHRYRSPAAGSPADTLPALG